MKEISPTSQQPPRLHLLDEARGFAVLCMVFFHAFFTMSVTFGMPAGTALLQFFLPAELYFAGFFILLSGFACRLSRSNAKRGGILLGIALGLTGVTYLLERMGMEGTVIWFGILHLLSLCMLLFALLRPLLDKIYPLLGALVCAALFIFFFPISDRMLGIPGVAAISLPDGWYQTDLLAPLGLYTDRFASADYFPLLPWLFLFLCGSFLGVSVKKGLCPRFFYQMHLRPLAFVGRHALIIYIAHQPVIFALLWLVQTAMNIGG